MNRYCFWYVVSVLVMHSQVFAQGAAGIEFETASTTPVEVDVGGLLRFNLIARDEHGSIVENWHDIGKDVVLTVRGSHAETDSSRRSWNQHSRAFTWIYLRAGDRVLHLDSVSEADGVPLLRYTIPRSIFDSGRSTLQFIQSGADTGIVLSLSPHWNFLRQDSPSITVIPGKVDNFLIEITSQTGAADEVYLYRPYEVVFTQRDAYLNTVRDRTTRVLFSAAYLKEIIPFQGGMDDVFSGPFMLHERRVCIFGSRYVRPDPKHAGYEEKQRLMLQAEADSSIRGESNPYSILHHAPYPFKLQYPGSDTLIKLGRSTNVEIFSWESPDPPDPLSNIRLSRFDSAKVISDEVTYKVRALDYASLTRAIEFDSDEDGELPHWTATHKDLFTILTSLSGIPTTREQSVLWNVEATDGLYVTESTSTGSEIEGHRLTIWKYNYHEVPVSVNAHSAVPEFFIGCNYPNPFRERTVIPVSINNGGHVRFRILNLIGETVAMLHEGDLSPGEYSFQFDGGNLPEGLYVYSLETSGQVVTGSMLLLR